MNHEASQDDTDEYTEYKKELKSVLFVIFHASLPLMLICCIYINPLLQTQILHTAKLICLVKPCVSVLQNKAVDVNPVNHCGKYTRCIL